VTFRPEQPPLILQRYRHRPVELAEVRANWAAWERLREMSSCPCGCGRPGFCEDRRAFTRSRCCEPGCDEARMQGRAYCPEHVEEDAA